MRVRALYLRVLCLSVCLSSTLGRAADYVWLRACRGALRKSGNARRERPQARPAHAQTATVRTIITTFLPRVSVSRMGGSPWMAGRSQTQRNRRSGAGRLSISPHARR